MIIVYKIERQLIQIVRQHLNMLSKVGATNLNDRLLMFELKLKS